ncbi:MAG: ATP-binding protein [Gemmatirosa sp.]
MSSTSVVRDVLASLAGLVPPAPAEAPIHRPLGDPERLLALRLTALLDSPAEEAFDRLTRLASRVLHAPIALVSLVDADRQFFKRCVGLPGAVADVRGTPLSHSFCRHAVERAEPLVIDDARTHPLVLDNGAVHDLDVIAYLGIPLQTADGLVLGSFCVIDHVPRRWTGDELETLRDLAASVMTEIELRTALRAAEEARAEAAEATRAKDDFLALVSHELRSPLAGIASNAQMLAMGLCGPVSDRQAKALARIRRSESHLLGLINQLLDLKKIAAGRMQYDFDTVHVQDVMRDACDLTEEQFASGGLLLERPASLADVAVRADAGKLRQILVNLLANAAEFTERGGTVTLACDAGPDGVRVRVRDTGIGIPAEHLESVFEPFVQVPDAHRLRTGGTGLGLAISRDLARGMGGDLTVASRPDEGSTFTLHLRPAS